jgi:hypothetical protein
MGESRCISIKNEADIIDARMQTRQIAKDAGLSTMDQARISLAVSSLARIMQLGDLYSGQITLNRTDELERSGVEVVWEIKTDCDAETILQNLNNSTLYMMVHDLDAKISEPSGICIRAMIWTPLATRIFQERAP